MEEKNKQQNKKERERQEESCPLCEISEETLKKLKKAANKDSSQEKNGK